MRCRSCAPLPEEVRRAADLLERRWTVSILYVSHEGAVRFNEFQQALGSIPPATSKPAICRDDIRREPSAYRDVVELNAAAAMLAADRVSSLEDGVALARETIQSGAAAAKLDQVADLSQKLKAGPAAGVR